MCQGNSPWRVGELAVSEFGDTALPCKTISLNLCKSSFQLEVKDQYLIMMNKYHLSINVCWIDLWGRPPQTPLHVELLHKLKILFPRATQCHK